MGQVNTWQIFLNNLSVSILVIAGGVIIIAPLFIIFFNGLGIGAILTLFGPVLGWPAVLGSVMIHGVFEILAFLLAGTMGIAIADRILPRGKKNHSWRELLLLVSQGLFIAVLPLLIIAATLETTLSQAFLQNAIKGLYQETNFDAVRQETESHGWYDHGISTRDYIKFHLDHPGVLRPFPSISRLTNNKGEELRLYVVSKSDTNLIESMNTLNKYTFIGSGTNSLWYAELYTESNPSVLQSLKVKLKQNVPN